MDLLQAFKLGMVKRGNRIRFKQGGPGWEYKVTRIFKHSIWVTAELNHPLYLHTDPDKKDEERSHQFMGDFNLC